MFVLKIDREPEYEGDYLGYGSYIDVTTRKPCTMMCMCNTIHFPYSYSFLVHTTGDETEVKFFSNELWTEVQKTCLLPNRHARSNDRSIDIGTLLRCKHDLAKNLSRLYANELIGLSRPGDQSRCLELSLLLNGILDDSPAQELAATESRHYTQEIFQSEMEQCSTDSINEESSPQSNEASRSGWFGGFNPWKKLRAQWKNRRQPNTLFHLEAKMNRLDSAIMAGWSGRARFLDDNWSTAGQCDEDDYVNRVLKAQIHEVQPRSTHDQSVQAKGLHRYSELDGREISQRYELHSECLLLPASADEQHRADLDLEYQVSIGNFNANSLTRDRFPTCEAFELDSRLLEENESFEVSKAKKQGHLSLAAGSADISPALAKKLEEGTFSVNDWILNAAMNEDIGLVQTLLDLRTDEDGMPYHPQNGSRSC